MSDRLPQVASEHGDFLKAVRWRHAGRAAAMQYRIENGWREFKRNYPAYNQA